MLPGRIPSKTPGKEANSKNATDLPNPEIILLKFWSLFSLILTLSMHFESRNVPLNGAQQSPLDMQLSGGRGGLGPDMDFCLFPVFFSSSKSQKIGFSVSAAGAAAYMPGYPAWPNYYQQFGQPLGTPFGAWPSQPYAMPHWPNYGEYPYLLSKSVYFLSFLYV